MYSVWVVFRVYCLDFDIGESVEGVCTSSWAADRLIKTIKEDHFKRCGQPWNEDYYHDGKLVVREHYLHTKGCRP